MAKKTYEQSIGRLEEIVAQLESGDSSMDDSIKLFEEGTKLVSFCNSYLDKAETKVRELSELEREAEQDD